MNVLVLLPLSAAQRMTLEAALPDARYSYASDDTVSAFEVAEAEVIVGNIAPARLPDVRRLQLLQLASAGYSAYLDVKALPANVTIASAVGAYGQAVSEHMFAMVLSLMKRLPEYRDDQRLHEWSDEGPVTTLRDAQVLVLGMGDIGGHFACLATAMGAHVAGARRHAAAVPPAGFESTHTMDELHALLGSADLVASFLPSSDTTRGLADAAFFSAMKPGSYFANAGRGDLVETDALITALESAHLAGAALDVTDPEPLPSDHRLWNAPNVFITPHVSGGFHLPEVLDNVVDIAAENIGRLAAGEPLRNAVMR